MRKPRNGGARVATFDFVGLEAVPEVVENKHVGQCGLTDSGIPSNDAKAVRVEKCLGCRKALVLNVQPRSGMDSLFIPFRLIECGAVNDCLQYCGTCQPELEMGAFDLGKVSQQSIQFAKTVDVGCFQDEGREQSLQLVLVFQC